MQAGFWSVYQKSPYFQLEVLPCATKQKRTGMERRLYLVLPIFETTRPEPTNSNADPKLAVLVCAVVSRFTWPPETF